MGRKCEESRWGGKERKMGRQKGRSGGGFEKKRNFVGVREGKI